MKLELRGITKRFGALVANDHIDLVVEPGEIHALLGENGAGKSTLMNVLYGLLPARRGRDPRRRRAGDASPGPATRCAAGIGMVHQHFMLVPVFTVAENVDARPRARPRGRRLPRPARGPRARSARSPSGTGCRSTRDALVEDLPVGVQQRVEIVKALIRDATGAHPRRADRGAHAAGDRRPAGGHAARCKAAGTSIVFITHKLREVRAVADRITVIRRGKVVGEASPTRREPSWPR